MVIILTCILLYFTFPYNLLKELVLEKINSKLNTYNLNVSAQNLKPFYVNGFTLEGVGVDYFNNPVPENISLDNFKVYLSLSSLFTGFLRLNICIQNTIDNTLNLSLKVPLMSPFQSSYKISSLSLDANSFDIGEILRLAYLSISKTQLSPTLSTFINPTIEKAELNVDLSGQVDIYSSSSLSDNIDSFNVNLSINKGLLRSKSAETQRLEKSQLIMNYKNKGLSIDKKTSLNTSDFSLDFYGDIAFAKSILDFQNSKFDLKFNYKNQGQPQALIELMSTYLNCPKIGNEDKSKAIKYSLKGQFGNLICQ